MIPLFDSLSHPTVSGKWLGNRPSTFDALSRELREANFLGACAVGLDGVEGYGHEAFLKACSAHPDLVPVAGFNPRVKSIAGEMDTLKRMGFKGIKIHPRFSRLNQADPVLVEVLKAAAERGLVVFYCTYYFCRVDAFPDRDPFYSLVSLLKEAPPARVVLVHGGGVELLRYAELARFNENLLLDLSMTLMKYPASSVDSDIRFLFRHFDRKICIGSDHPEYSHVAVRERFDFFSEGVSQDKLENVAFRNIRKFLGIE